MAGPPFKPDLVRAVFRDVTSLQISRTAARTAASVTRTVLTEIIDAAGAAAAEEARKRLIPEDLIAAIDRNVEVEVGSGWYLYSPTFHGLLGEVRNAEGVLVSLRERRGTRTPSGVAGAHRFEPGVRRLLGSRGVRAVPALVRDLDGIASVFLTDLARDAAGVVRGGGRTVGGNDVVTAVGRQLFGALRQRALTEAAETTRHTSAG
ncbi:hypothetical protein G3I33_17920 [Streptomyces sp. SID9124]|nr:hypothetical protein [Streptomyces sp. SID9124]